MQNLPFTQAEYWQMYEPRVKPGCTQGPQSNFDFSLNEELKSTLYINDNHGYVYTKVPLLYTSSKVSFMSIKPGSKLDYWLFWMEAQWSFSSRSFFLNYYYCYSLPMLLLNFLCSFSGNGKTASGAIRSPAGAFSYLWVKRRCLSVSLFSPRRQTGIKIRVCLGLQGILGQHTHPIIITEKRERK